MKFPTVTLADLPDIEDEEVCYWIHRINVIRDVMISLYERLFAFTNHPKISIAFLAAILMRQFEITDSIFILVSKGRTRDAGILILNLYELTLDLQFVSLNPGSEDKWVNHVQENKKPWSVHEQIKKILTSENEFNGEKKFYKSLSMIKHGNSAGKYISFDIFLLDEKLVISETTIASFIPNLFSIGYILRRTFDAAIEILKGIDINEAELEAEMKRVYGKFHHNFITVMEYNTVKLLNLGNADLQEKLLKKVDLYET